VALTLTLGDAALVSLISTPFWLVISARRLHDFGRSGWWGAVPFCLGFVLGSGTALGLPMSATRMAFANVAVALGMTIGLGSIPGHTEKNRFGVQAANRA